MIRPAPRPGADSGLEELFQRLWRQQHPRLVQQSLKLMGGNHADAEEALGMTMLRLWQALPTYAGRIDNERAWLHRMLFNACMDLHRDSRRQARRDTCPPEELELEEPDEQVDPSRSIEKRLCDQVVGEEIQKCIHQLQIELRVPFQMRFEEEMEYEEIAKAMNLTSVNVRKRIQKARAHLRRMLSAVRNG